VWVGRVQGLLGVHVGTGVHACSSRGSGPLFVVCLLQVSEPSGLSSEEARMTHDSRNKHRCEGTITRASA